MKKLLQRSYPHTYTPVGTKVSLFPILDKMKDGSCFKRKYSYLQNSRIRCLNYTSNFIFAIRFFHKSRRISGRNFSITFRFLFAFFRFFTLMTGGFSRRKRICLSRRFMTLHFSQTLCPGGLWVLHCMCVKRKTSCCRPPSFSISNITVIYSTKESTTMPFLDT